MTKEKKFNISTRTIILSLIAIVSIATPLTIYFLNRQDDPSVLSWYNSSWNYKREISVGNSSGSILSNEDVLITLEDSGNNVSTSTLISQGKLQSDCDDLRFVDSDDSTLLEYWIEGGCNTSKTQVWVRIPSLPVGGKTIYMYYDNDSAVNGEVSWTGNFISLSDQSSCGSGWSQFSALDGRFPRGSSAYGSTGGATTHSHTGYGSTTSNGGSTTVQGGATWGPTASQGGAHTHSVSVSLTSNVNHMPPYVNMLYCSNDKVEALSNHITLYDTSTVTGWTRYTALDSRFPYGATSSIGGTGGATTHTHTVSFSLGSYGGSRYIGTTCSSNCHYPIVSNHSHSVGSVTTTGNNIPAYLTMVYMKMTTANTLTTERPIYIMNTATMPLGWERFSALDNKFPMGSSAYGSSGGSDSHAHSGSKTTGTVSTLSALWYDSGNFNGITNHSHTVNWNTGSAVSNLPPYLSVIFAKRKDTESTIVGPEISQNTTPTAPTSLLTEGLTNPTNITDFTPEFSAIYNDPDTLDQANYYQIQVNTTSTFDGTTMWDSTKTSMTAVSQGNRCSDISYAGSTLNTNVTYYWRIKFWDVGGAESPWSSTANFKINRAPTAPTDLLTENQTNPNNITDFTPEFSAIYDDPDTTDTSSYYEIEVNTVSDFSGTVMWDSGKSTMTTTNEGNRSPDISYAGSTLSANTTYYWRIKFWDSVNNESPWSSTANFKINRAPTAPTDLLTEGQTNPTAIKDTTPEFSAIYDDPDTTDTSSYYEIEVNTVSDFSGTVMWDSGKSTMTTTNEGNRSPDISYAGNALSIKTTYYWRIKFWDTVDNEGAWSNVANFKIDIAPTATDLLIIGETNPSQIFFDVYFSAIYSDPNSDNSSAYQIQVNTSNTFDGTIMWDSAKTSITISPGNRSPNIYYNGTDLEYDGTTYYVRMKFWDTDDNASDWVTGQFTDTLKSFQFNGLQMNGLQLN